MHISTHRHVIKDNKNKSKKNWHSSFQGRACFNIKNVTTHETDNEINYMTYFPAENMRLSSLSWENKIEEDPPKPMVLFFQENAKFQW